MHQKVYGIQSDKLMRDSAIESRFDLSAGKSTLERAPNDNTFDQAITLKLTDFMKNRRTNSLIQKIKDERGRNNPIKYQDHFQFKQQWQLTNKLDNSLNYNYLFPQKFISIILNGIILFLLIFLIWLLSIFRLFQYKDTLIVFTYSFIVNLLDTLLKIFFMYELLSEEKNKNKQKHIHKREYAQIFIGNLLICLYSILGMTRVISNVDNDIYLILDFACIFFVYLRCEEIYKNFKILMICSKYKAYMKIYDLMSNLFLLTHIFGVLIYGISRFQPSQTYLTVIEVKTALSWFDRYIYSIYFSSTTMLTVGYGDLLPSNVQEITVVLVMQLFGIVMIGYINGEVGDVLCTLRMERQSLENDLRNSQKLSQSYKLNHATSQKIKQHLINNRKLDQQLNIQEENKLLSKISDQLRLQTNYTYHINIIKQSLLFVYNFSKKIQIEVSYKLNKIVLSPNESLPQIMGKQKIYLLSKGQIALYVAKRDKKIKNAKKLSRVLSKNDKNDFYKNSFGHIALILGRPTELKAFSKDFAICHTIQRHDLLEALNLDSNDFERFHQMRGKYQTCKHPEKYECPQFYSIRQHYAPTPEFVIKRYLKQSIHTKRKQWIREREKSRTILQSFDNMKEGQMYEQTSEKTESSASTVVEFEKISEEKILNKQQRQNKYKMVSLNKLISIHSRNYESKYMNKKYQEKREQLVRKFKLREFEEPFEVIRQYGSFFKHANISNILKKFTYSNSLLQIMNPFLEILPTFYQQNSKTSQLNTEIFTEKRLLRSLPI